MKDFIETCAALAACVLLLGWCSADHASKADEAVAEMRRIEHEKQELRYRIEDLEQRLNRRN